MSGKSTPIPGSVPGPLPDLGCACATLRRAARLVTQLYSEEMGSRPEPAQFSLLTALGHLPGASQTTLGNALGLDKTTLSRNLGVLRRRGWIEPSPGSQDQRQRGFRLTTSGRKAIVDAKPAWTRAQARLRSALPPQDWDGLFEVLNRVATAALDKSAEQTPRPSRIAGKRVL